MQKECVHEKLTLKPKVKPLLRGHFHQAAFFLALGACAMLIAKANGTLAVLAITIYSMSLVGLFGISALYHRPQWSASARLTMRKLDHASIFLLIAGSITPICLLGVRGHEGQKLLFIAFVAASLGILQSFFWVHAPKWFTAALCVTVGWLAIPFLPAVKAGMPADCFPLLFAGGALYTLGAVIYALKWPNPWPHVFGYHEIFHLLVVFAALFHFLMIHQLLSNFALPV